MNTKEIHIKDYNYNLPDERIAKFPIPERDHSKLLIYNKGTVSDDKFYNISQYLPKDMLMVFNNTRVIQARMYFYKETGAAIEVFLLEPDMPSDYEQMFQTTGHCSWLCMVGNLKKWKSNPLSRSFDVNGRMITLTVSLREEVVNSRRIDFNWDDNTISFAEILNAIGELPIPPYLNRETQESDKVTYQTVYSKIKGSVAAPTAGLHFTNNVLDSLTAKGIERDELTLHVGAGTFKPVKADVIENHEMHTEYIYVRKPMIENLIRHNANAIAVGTTSVRTLESLYYLGLKLEHNPQLALSECRVGQWDPYDDGDSCNEISPLAALKNIVAYLDRNNLDVLHMSTQIMIAPGYHYKIVKALVTNFHQPQSTLLLLVSAFVNGDWKKIYDYALSNDFRFLSYGDSSLLIP